MTASIMNHLEIEMTHDNDLIRRGDVLNLPTYDGDGDPSGTFDHKIFVKLEAIAALPAVAASQTADPVINADSCQRVVVKPLVWEGHSDDQRSGDYVIKPSYGQGPKRLLLARGSKLVSWHDDMDEAQRAGQDDHEARILAAIDVQPDPRDAQIAALVNAGGTVIDQYWNRVHGVSQLAIHNLRIALAVVKGENK